MEQYVAGGALPPGTQALVRRQAPRIGEGYRLGVDVGGTFTDLMLIDEKSGKTYVAKVSSTPKDSSIGVLNGIEKICREASIDPSQINIVMHGTTVATNTVLTGSGALVGLVTTQGLPADAADRPLLRSGRPRRLGDLQQARRRSRRSS